MNDARCYFCKGLVGDGPARIPSVLVTFETGTVECCDICYERGEEGIDRSPDYTDRNPEGDPTVNGAYGG